MQYDHSVPCPYPVEPSPSNSSQRHDIGESKIPRYGRRVRNVPAKTQKTLKGKVDVSTALDHKKREKINVNSP
ncbi:hypothetical protein H2248_004593 [Termitomyces sp. 'cryptogamus']|nr:hypothetical protein H2248_004593 [Termitomyces sp. 'cryptogamus']